MRKSTLFPFVFWLALGQLACTTSPDEIESASFLHDIVDPALPWTHETFDAANDKFTFAVFSDLTGGEREGIFATAIAQLNLLRPELIINVGDLIDGGSEDLVEIAAQWDSFDERAERARAPVFYVGGNHDLTGTVLQGIWDERIGRRYYHFVYKDVLFLVLDTEDNTPDRTQEIFEIRKAGIEVYVNEGPEAFAETAYANLPEKSSGNLTVEQSTYLVEAIAANPDVRWTFLFMHKAPWERADETNFAVVEEALVDRPYTVFNGHVHTYEHIERRGRDYIRLATTGGKQFSDLGRSMDHVTLVTVDDKGVDIANLLMSGVLDKTGHVPLRGDEVCFDLEKCTNAGKN
jgi:3',5'-cyclic AMP phosphodiesterase CpdA